MNMLTSIAASALLVWLVLTGGDIQLHSLEVGYDSRPGEVWLHPTWIVEVDHRHPVLRGGLGMAWGNVAVVYQGNPRRILNDTVVQHELTHIQQFRALGPSLFLIAPLDAALNGQLLNIEGYTGSGGMCISAMWVPKAGWPFLWSWLVISLDG